MIMDGVRADDEGTVNYYWVAAVTPELYQSYLVIVDATGTGLWVEIVVGVSAAGFLLIVAGIVVSLCARRRGKGTDSVTLGGGGGVLCLTGGCFCS